MNVPAACAYISGQSIADRDDKGDISPAVIAVVDHEYSIRTVI